jgi:hypothetical protein
VNPTGNGPAVPHQGPNHLAVAPRILVFGYYDGPTDGVIQLGESGPVFRFTMPDEEGQLSRGGRVREFHLAPLPADALDRLAAVLAPHLTPQWPVWVPIWRFPTPDTQRAVEAQTDAILAKAGPVAWRVTTADYWAFQTFQAEPVAAGQPA